VSIGGAIHTCAALLPHADVLCVCSAAIPFSRQGGTFCSQALVTTASSTGVVAARGCTMARENARRLRYPPRAARAAPRASGIGQKWKFESSHNLESSTRNLDDERVFDGAVKLLSKC
jgi:hypothetical protein